MIVTIHFFWLFNFRDLKNRDEKKQIWKKTTRRDKYSRIKSDNLNRHIFHVISIRHNSDRDWMQSHLNCKRSELFLSMNCTRRKSTQTDNYNSSWTETIQRNDHEIQKFFRVRAETDRFYVEKFSWIRKNLHRWYRIFFCIFESTYRTF